MAVTAVASCGADVIALSLYILWFTCTIAAVVEGNFLAACLYAIATWLILPPKVKEES